MSETILKPLVLALSLFIPSVEAKKPKEKTYNTIGYAAVYYSLGCTGFAYESHYSFEKQHYIFNTLYKDKVFRWHGDILSHNGNTIEVDHNKDGFADFIVDYKSDEYNEFEKTIKQIMSGYYLTGNGINKGVGVMVEFTLRSFVNCDVRFRGDMSFIMTNRWETRKEHEFNKHPYLYRDMIETIR